jgi:hypothetical protein
VERVASLSNDLDDTLANPTEQAVFVLILQMIIDRPGLLKMPSYSVGWLRESGRMAIWRQVMRLMLLFREKLNKAYTQVRAAAVLVSTVYHRKPQA